MGIPYYEPAIDGTVELISRRIVHVDGRDKAVLVYRYVCGAEGCDWFTDAPGLARVRDKASAHMMLTHKLNAGAEGMRNVARMMERPPPPPPGELPGF